MQNKIQKIVLTGTIGSGKTTVAKYFAELGVKVIDADIIVHEILLNPEIIATIKEHFNARVVDTEGKLQHKILREIIFNDSAAKQWLEGLLHPLVIKEINNQIAAIKTESYCLVVIPLFLETREHYQIADRVLVIDAPEKLQIARIMARDHTSAAMAQKILAQQANRQELLACADEVIVNNNSLNELKKQVEKLHQKYQNINKNLGKLKNGNK
jgi:dephospho-CoA kinase